MLVTHTNYLERAKQRRAAVQKSKIRGAGNLRQETVRSMELFSHKHL